MSTLMFDFNAVDFQQPTTKGSEHGLRPIQTSMEQKLFPASLYTIYVTVAA